MATHRHERWQLRIKPGGGVYCAACGEDVSLAYEPQLRANLSEDEQRAWLNEKAAVAILCAWFAGRRDPIAEMVYKHGPVTGASFVAG